MSECVCDRSDRREPQKTHQFQAPRKEAPGAESRGRADFLLPAELLEYHVYIQ